jgi:hypothetical protein
VSAPIVTLAEQVKDLINTAGAFVPDPDLSAARQWQYFFDLPAAKDAKFSVYPGADKTIERSDRGAWRHELTVEIVVQQKLADDDNSTKDALVAKADAICEYVKANWANGTFELIDGSIPNLVQHPLVQQNKLFTCAVVLRFWQFR